MIDVVTADRLVVDARVRAQRRAAPLGPVLGERLDALALVQQRGRVELRRGLRTLARARMPADLLPSCPAPPEPLVHAARGELRLAHGLDDRRAAVAVASPAAK